MVNRSALLGHKVKRVQEYIISEDKIQFDDYNLYWMCVEFGKQVLLLEKLEKKNTFWLKEKSHGVVLSVCV